MRALDFFCGAGGMTNGLLSAGIEVLGGIDNDVSCRDTYELNNVPARFINRDITKLSFRELSREVGIEQHADDLVFVGCSPCQYWSKIITDKSKSQQSAFLLREFQRFVHWFSPGFVVIENVPGLLTNKRQSILPEFLSFLDDRGYSHAQGVVNALKYGVPQNRKRYLLIASRVVANVSLPPEEEIPGLTVRGFIGQHNGFSQIPAGHIDPTQRIHTTAGLSPQNLRRIAMTPPNGGTSAGWRANPELQIEAYRGRDEMFQDVYGRMYWDRPAPTITTRFNSLSNGRFGHPEEHRALSLREGATLQTFPPDYIFKAKNQAGIARQIGNAVPPSLARRVGEQLIYLQENG